MVRLNKIYTRTGDGGDTHLSDGSRCAKSSPRFAAIGAVDELNSALGLTVRVVLDAALRDDLSRIQNELFDLGADLSHPGPDEEKDSPPLRIVLQQVKNLELDIDRMNQQLSPLRSFVLPGGTEAGARLHFARAVCRRAEREALLIPKEQWVNPCALAYLNRLSDYLFVAARYVNASGDDEVLWQPGASRGSKGQSAC